jgi:hypothetical protein
MSTCRICLKSFKKLRFNTEHIGICGRCINTLNDAPEPAKNAEARLADMLARGMRRNAELDLLSEAEWKRRKAHKTLDNFDAFVSKALPDWLNRLLARSENNTRDFKIMRAHRRGLLRMDGYADYPSNWAEIARTIRVRDDRRCVACGDTDKVLDVHHIVYLSKHGTNQQSNLITLCRPCHEHEHDRVFDLLEQVDPELSTGPSAACIGVLSQSSLQALHKPTLAMPTLPKPAPAPQVAHKTATQCPRCRTELAANILDLRELEIRCPQCGLIFPHGCNDRQRSFPPPQPPQAAVVKISTSNAASDVPLSSALLHAPREKLSRSKFRLATEVWIFYALIVASVVAVAVIAST